MNEPFGNSEQLPAGDLRPGEHHPAALDALAWVKSQSATDLWAWQETLASNAMAGNRTAELCSETLHRLLAGEGVGPQYILALAWTMRYGEVRPSKSMARRHRALRGESLEGGREHE